MIGSRKQQKRNPLLLSEIPLKEALAHLSPRLIIELTFWASRLTKLIGQVDVHLYEVSEGRCRISYTWYGREIVRFRYAGMQIFFGELQCTLVDLQEGDLASRWTFVRRSVFQGHIACYVDHILQMDPLPVIQEAESRWVGERFWDWVLAHAFGSEVRSPDLALAS